jgi:hypothetical protein
MNKLYNLIDQQLLNLLITWDQIHDDLMDAALHLPEDWDDWRMDMHDHDLASLRYDADSEMLKGIELAARKLISSAEDAHLISLDDWRVLNAIICNIGTDDPDTAARLWWRTPHMPDCCNPSFLEVCDDL